MTMLRLSSLIVIAAGFAALCSVAQAQTKTAAAADAGKDGKHAPAGSVQSPNVHQMRSQNASKSDPVESDMILLQEPLRPGLAMPVSMSRGK